MKDPLIRLTLAFLVTLPAAAAHPTHIPSLKKFKKDPGPNYLDEYLKTARAANPPAPATVGSLWVSTSPMAWLASDYRAARVGDLLIVHLSDNFTAGTSGENKQTRSFNSNSAITGLLGALAAKNRLQNLFNATSANGLDGKGQSTMSSNVTLNFSAQVIEVLPNGVMVLQASRDLAVGNDRQTVVLRGLVRPGDIAPDNSISSSSISNLQVELKGKGAVAEIMRQPNIVIRTLLKLFTF
jgi:flagellar L-ring protein precursor FlgH